MMEKIKNQADSQNRAIKEQRRKIFLLVLLFVVKFVIFPWLSKKIMDYCLSSGKKYAGNDQDKNNFSRR